MTRTSGILTLIAGLTIAGCADNMAWHNDNTAQYNNPSNTTTTDNNGRIRTPDNPQVAGNDKTRGISNLSADDMQFIRDANAGGMYEVNSSEKALLKSSDTNVKNLAQHMIDDHQKANSQLTALASRKTGATFGGVTPDQLNMLSQLDKLSGTDFDREYLRQQKTAHEDTIAKFQSESNSGNDKDLRDWATSMLPTLRDHLQMVTDENNRINNITPSDTNRTNTNMGGTR
ncbi:MAG TPA: DUF4142 domain-containing protein [Phycisphaerae bacterium]|jgi:putative membrane protein